MGPPLYRHGKQTVLYNGLVHDVLAREVRGDLWWYKIRYHLYLLGSMWVPENDPYLGQFP